MKRTIIAMAFILASITAVRADDRPVTFNQLPEAARNFITDHYPDDKVSFATVDDDFIMPDYQVALVSGVMLKFSNDGSLEKIESRTGKIPSGIIPVQITKAVKEYYPDEEIIMYEVDRRSYEVKLTNRLELKFNRHFKVIEIDN